MPAQVFILPEKPPVNPNRSPEEQQLLDELWAKQRGEAQEAIHSRTDEGRAEALEAERQAEIDRLAAEHLARFGDVVLPADELPPLPPSQFLMWAVLGLGGAVALFALTR